MVPHDGRSVGHLQVRGAHAVDTYFKKPQRAVRGFDTECFLYLDAQQNTWKLASSDCSRCRLMKTVCAHPFAAAQVDENNWFSTGDVACIDPLGYMTITDRSKDVVKSGGEWISSIGGLKHAR